MKAAYLQNNHIHMGEVPIRYQFPTSRDTTLHAGRLGEAVLERIEIPERLLRDEIT
jgi:hypothetical protein